MEVKNIESIVNEVMESIMKDRIADRAKIDAVMAKKMEHSMIRFDATPEMVRRFCAEAVQYGFRNVALPPCYVSYAAEILTGTGVKVATAVGFPMAIASTKIKVAETIDVIDNGATEIDLPVNIGLVKAGELKAVKADIDAVIAAAEKRAQIKVAVDLGSLTKEEIIKVTLLARLSGADFIKVAQCSRKEGVNAEDIAFIRQIAGNDIQLKADGGVRSHAAALEVIAAGAATIGSSSSPKVVTIQ